MNTAKACGIHLGVVMVASEEGAKKENWFLVNSPFMQDYMTKHLGSEKILLYQIHQALCISEQRSEDVVVVRACLRPGTCYILVLMELRCICRMDTQGDKSLLDA